VSGYAGRFAPSPTGLLHAGSLVAALASWLDARASDGRWLVRIEDLDTPRNVDGAVEGILAQLARCGLVPDAPPVRQSARTALYAAALARLEAAGLAYPCGCSRRDLAIAGGPSAEARSRHAERVYPGTCRSGLHGKAPRSVRLRTDLAAAEPVVWVDRRLGPMSEDVAAHVGDFVLERADGIWAYQLAVVVDDAAQGITDVVRGEDLASNTARQILLQRCLGLPTPRYLHTPLVRAASGEKLSKQTGAEPLSLDRPLEALRAAAAVLDLDARGTGLAHWLASAVAVWRARWPRA
jgi:glutamyl-Q tRNA(Asp) synthetase